MKLALFDLDHTLIPFDSDYEWNEFTIALGWRDGDVFRQANDAFFAQYRDGTLNIHDYVRFATQAIRNKGAIESIAAHACFYWSGGLNKGPIWPKNYPSSTFGSNLARRVLKNALTLRTFASVVKSRCASAW